MASKVKDRTKGRVDINNKGEVKVAGGLKEHSPGVMVNKTYKPGADPAMDAVLNKLKNDGPGSLDRSGFQPVQRVKKKTKRKTKTA